jgi:hypothetical protein
MNSKMVCVSPLIVIITEENGRREPRIKAMAMATLNGSRKNQRRFLIIAESRSSEDHIVKTRKTVTLKRVDGN